jgi:hypothetical protein
MEKSKSVQKLILLIGSNPMPNFISVLMFKPQKVWFCYTSQTEKVKKNLESVLKEVYSFESEEIFMPNAGDPENVRKAFEQIEINENTYLNYTGGTKVMAAQVRMVFEQKGGDKSRAFYIYEPDGLMRFDNGNENELEVKTLEPTTIFSLHGIEVKSKREKQIVSHPSLDDAKKITKEILKNPDLANKLYDLQKENGKDLSFTDAKKKPVNLQKEFGLDLSIKFFPEDNWNKATYEKWGKFLHGVWLEEVVGDLIKSLYPKDPIQIGTDCQKNDRQFEIDVILTKGHRLYVVSCTTSQELGLCKSKLFEIAVRARQLGGDLARSAFVCLLYGGNDQGPYIDQLRNDIKDLWDAPNTPRVFGLDHLREWMNGRLKSLKEWLEN